MLNGKFPYTEKNMNNDQLQGSPSQDDHFHNRIALRPDDEARILREQQLADAAARVVNAPSSAMVPESPSGIGMAAPSDATIGAPLENPLSPSTPASPSSFKMPPNTPQLAHDDEASGAPARFPWIRAILIGVLVPTIAYGINIGVIYLLGVTMSPKSLLMASVYLVALPYVTAAVAVIIGTWSMSRLGVSRPFLLSLGTMVFASGVSQLIAVLNSSLLGVSWGWATSSVATALFSWRMLVIPLAGGVGMGMLAFVVYVIGRRWKGFIAVPLFLAIIAAPWAGSYVVQSQKPTIDDMMTHKYELSEYGKEKDSKVAASNGRWPLLPVSLYPSYDGNAIKACLEHGFVVGGVKNCVLRCVQTIEGQCIEMSIKSGEFKQKESRPYLFKDGKCDPSGFGNVAYLVNTGESLPTARPVACSSLKTPNGRTVYAQSMSPAGQYQPGMLSYYFTEGDAAVYVGIITSQDSSDDTKVRRILTQAQQDVLNFIDTFKVASRN